MSTDITKDAARKRAQMMVQIKAQEEMRVSEIRYRRLFESARDGILILDANTRKITDANPFMTELLGYSREAFVGKELWEIGLLKDAEASAAAFRELQENGYIRYEDLPLQTNWGKRREVEFVSNVYAEAGHQVIQCNIRDITERKRADRAVRQSAERFTFLIESMPQKIFTTKPNGEVDYANWPWTEFSGLSCEQMKGVDWKRLLHPDDVAENTRIWKHAIATGEPFQRERRFRRVDGVYRWHVSHGRAMRNKQGHVLMWIVSCTDIEDQKQSEIVLRALMTNEHAARDAAEAANRTKDEFLATVSHELRTPLTVILGYAFMLRSGVLNTADASRALASIERSAKAQSQLIEDILDVSRIIVGKFRLEARPLGLVATITAAVDSLRVAAEAKAIHIQTHLDCDAGMVSGDPLRLGQVMSNLLSNAVKFTPAGGRVTVRLDCVKGQAQITVSDTGQGISADFLPHVFDHFRQADSASTRSHSGLGLGLSIVHNIVEMHGGTVHAASPGVGQGATFTVRLPLLPLRTGVLSPTDGAQPPDARFARPSEISGLRILVVDDEPNTLEMLRVILEQGGAEVRTCGSAVAALEAMQQEKPDFLISDMAMPGHDGYWLIEQVREQETGERETGKRLPAVALTAYISVEDRANVLVAGFDMFVPKPVEPLELLAIVASLARTEVGSLLSSGS